MSKIYWDGNEMTAVIAAAAKSLRDGTAATQLEALNLANKTLPKHRQRPTFKTLSRLDWFNQGLVAKVVKNSYPAAVQKVELGSVEPPSDNLKAALVDLIVTAMESPRGQEALRRAMRPDVPPPPRAVATAHTKDMLVERFAGPKRKVLIVGLLGVQAETVKQSYSDKLELRFLSQEDTVKRMREQSRGVDVTIGMVGFMSHPQDKALNKESENYRRVSNGVSGLKSVLHSIANGG